MPTARQGLRWSRSVPESLPLFPEELQPRVFFSDFNPDSLNIVVYYWFNPPEWWEYMEFTHDFNMELLSRFNEAGIEFAFPTQTLHVDSLAAPGAQRQVPPALPRGELESVIRDFGPGGAKGQPGGHLVTHGYFANLPTVRGSSPDADEDASAAGRA